MTTRAVEIAKDSARCLLRAVAGARVGAGGHVTP